MIAKDCPPVKDKEFYDKIMNYDYSKILTKHKTPVAIYFKDRIIQNIDSIKKQFKEFQKKEFFYAMKANAQPKILKIIKDAGMGVEVMSEFELKLALEVGFNPEKIIFNGPAKTDQALKLAVNKKIKCIIIDSLSETKKLVKLDKKLLVMVRCHPNLPKLINKKLFVPEYSKLGLSLKEKEIWAVLETIKESKLTLNGFSFNIAARQRNFNLHSQALESILGFYNKLDNKTKNKIKIIDIGGGFDSPLFIKDNFKFKKEIINFFKDKKIKLFVEPGRSITNDAGIVLTKIITAKNTGNKNYLFVDIATNYLIPLPLSYYVIDSQKKYKKQGYSIVDGICSTVGVINDKCILSISKENEILLIINCGAYTFNMHEHFYETRPTIILLDKDKKQILNKKETFNTAYKAINN
jgi:diaminopimelate decarboxylase